MALVSIKHLSCCFSVDQTVFDLCSDLVGVDVDRGSGGQRGDIELFVDSIKHSEILIQSLSQ